MVLFLNSLENLKSYSHYYFSKTDNWMTFSALHRHCYLLYVLFYTEENVSQRNCFLYNNTASLNFETGWTIFLKLSKHYVWVRDSHQYISFKLLATLKWDIWIIEKLKERSYESEVIFVWGCSLFKMIRISVHIISRH